ncbi:DUF7662 domain-containing protein [Deinococcus marmoris]|uniref:DUF7662 domain-containing protein n=1 Tax=Deinococcus marmoris TaxID=249408 RepID=UPI0011153317|nr:hypothetical protein [Deinococcus marmoris]
MLLLDMKKTSIRISDGEQEFSYLVSSEVAGMLIRQLNDAVFPSPISGEEASRKFDFNQIRPRYRELARHLYGREEETFCMTFSQIEDIIGKSLPASARKYNAWWANTRSHPYSAAWLDIGRRTCELDLGEETVVFQKK